MIAWQGISAIFGRSATFHALKMRLRELRERIEKLEEMQRRHEEEPAEAGAHSSGCEL